MKWNRNVYQKTKQSIALCRFFGVKFSNEYIAQTLSFYINKVIRRLENCYTQNFSQSIFFKQRYEFNLKLFDSGKIRFGDFLFFGRLHIKYKRWTKGVVTVNAKAFHIDDSIHKYQFCRDISPFLIVQNILLVHYVCVHV